MVPEALPYKHELVLASGAVEIAAAGLLLHPSTRRIGGAAAVALLVGGLAGQRADDRRRRRQNKPWWQVGALVARLPLQVPLLRIALRAARGS